MPLQQVHEHIAGQHDSGSFRIIKALAVLMGLGLLALFALVLADSRRDTLRFATQADASLAKAISQDISMTFESYDLSLKGARLALTEPGLANADEMIRQFAIFDHSASARFMTGMAVINSQGEITARSRSKILLPPGRLTDQDFFTRQRDSGDDLLIVSRPLHVENDSWVVVLSRRIIWPDGTFGGVVIGSLSLNYFQAMFQNLGIDRQNILSILGTDGTVYIRQPYRQMEIGHDLSSSRIFKLYATQQHGFYEQVSPIDHVERLYTFTRVPNLPLIVVAGSAKTVILEGWWRKAAFMGVILALLMAALVTAGTLLAREFRLRRRAEKRLTATAARLAHMATRDSLTTLANRRSFDDTAAREWKRAIRNQSPFSLLLLDVDHFKNYNDEHGHLRGDDALIAVAGCVRKHLKRPADFAARYGGEEFVVLLPDTDQNGAQIVAEDIRRSIEIVHLANGAPQAITISIGVTTALPERGQPFATAFAAADKALYCAKRLGRNRVECNDYLPADNKEAGETPAS